MEAVTIKKPEAAGIQWLEWVEGFISSPSNTLKHEASRIIGNIAHLFPDKLNTAIEKLLILIIRKMMARLFVGVVLTHLVELF